MITKVNIPWHSQPEFIKKIENIGENGFDYKKTEEVLKVATKKMTENANKLK